MFARIHQPSRTAMQSGTRGSNKWVIDLPKSAHRAVDPLTGTTASQNMARELNLEFDTKESAIAYARSNSIPYQLIERTKGPRKGRGYSDNFAYDRKFPWTH